MTTTTRTPHSTDATQSTTHDPQSEPKTARNEGHIQSQIKIQNGSHLGITIRWGGPDAGAPGPEVPGGRRC